MTLSDLRNEILARFPNAQIELTDDNQIIIYTNLYATDPIQLNGKPVRFLAVENKSE